LQDKLLQTASSYSAEVNGSRSFSAERVKSGDAAALMTQQWQSMVPWHANSMEKALVAAPLMSG
jgi:hypothetical protein